ncbi:MAG: NAD(P)H-dependent oxidoreductase [Candidatus Micrarchaeia archaeon]
MAKNIVVILAHPDMGSSKLNKRLVQAAKETGATVHEIYSAYPDGKIDVAREQGLLAKADTIVLQFPFYWYSTPSLLKQWEDDVLAYGFAYGSKGKALAGKKLMVATTTGRAADAYAKTGSAGFTLDELLAPLEATSNLCGMVWQPVFSINEALKISDEELERGAQEYKKRLMGL